MTPEERKRYEERRRAYFEAKRRAEEEQKRQTRRKIVIISAVVLTFAVVFGIAAIIISASLRNDQPSDPETFTYVIGDSSEKVAYKDAERGGVLCIDMRKLKSDLGLTESSMSSTSVTFTARSTGSKVVFSDGSAIATVNNVSTVKMPVAAKVSAKVCSVPIETVASIIDGIIVTVRSNKVIIEKTGTVDICAKTDEPLSPIISFVSNLDAYEEYMNPTGENRDAFLMLVNKEKPLGENFVPDELVTLDAIYCQNLKTNQMNATAAMALEAMLIELWAATGDKSIIGTSGYRSYAYQVQLFEGYIENEMATGLSYEAAREKVLTYSAAPGSSEHQSGLCMDLYDTDFGVLENPFTRAETAEWLANNAWKFGFILRYPEDKTDITGYDYESWHFRFVGRYHAEKITSADLTLEEYLETLK